MEKRSRRIFTPEQQFAMLQDIETFPTVKAGLEKYQLSHSVYQNWKRQLAVGVRASLQNSNPLKAPDLRWPGSREHEAQGGRPDAVLDDHGVKKSDERGLKGGGQLMDTQKIAILKTVAETRRHGRRMGDVLATLGINRATYYRWKKGDRQESSSPPPGRTSPLLPEERQRIVEVKAAHPTYRHQRIQGGVAGGGALGV